jgi:hypothetical protein
MTKMKACENHNECIIVFNHEDGCPLCRAEGKLKAIWEEIEKSMAIMRRLTQVAEEAGLKPEP